MAELSSSTNVEILLSRSRVDHEYISIHRAMKHTKHLDPFDRATTAYDYTTLPSHHHWAGIPPTCTMSADGNDAMVGDAMGYVISGAHEGIPELVLSSVAVILLLLTGSAESLFLTTPPRDEDETPPVTFSL
jgi:hypothetical protein